MSAPSPVPSTMFKMALQSWLTESERALSSPGLYFLKKLAGSERSRIIMDASTPSEIFVFSRVWTISFMLLTSCEETSTHTMKIAMATNTSVLPLESTGPVSMRLIWGMSIPTSVAAKVAPAIMAKSLKEMQFFM